MEIGDGMKLGEVYQFTTWELDDEWEYNHGNRYRPIQYSTDYGVFIGNYEHYRLFIVLVPDALNNNYKILYVENDLWLEETDFEADIPLLDKLIRYINSRSFKHPVILPDETTSINVPEGDIIQFSDKYSSNLKGNIKNFIMKRPFKKKITNWMTALPPAHEIGFSGGPFYKRAAESYKKSGGKRKANKTRKINKLRKANKTRKYDL
jgi:hypothetical protein